MAQFKDLFTELRRDTGLSQEDFAALFHQSGSTISSYETGRNQPSFDMLIQYADYFNVTTDYLLGRVPFDIFCLDQVWNSLDSKTQYLLSAKYLLNKSGKEIANDLGMSSDNVRMALVRAKRKARQAMEDWKHSTNQAK